MKRRLILLAGLIALSVSSIADPASTAIAAEAKRFEPVVTDDGLLAQPWFLTSFLDLKEDHAEAMANDKRFAVIWELRGCPYCKVLHTTNLARPNIQKLAHSNFEILQLNIIGSRKVVDFDGEELTEKQLARKHGVRFTPSMQFFGKTVSEETGAKNEVARMAGYYKPFHFYTLLEFVSSGAYERTKFRQYLKRKYRTLVAKGVDVEKW